MDPQTSILQQAARRRSELVQQGRLDSRAWLDLVPLRWPPAQWAVQVVRAGLLGMVAEERTDEEEVRTGSRARGGSDCEDRVLRLMHAVLAIWPGVKVELEFVGNPPWHVRLLVDGYVVETMPRRNLVPPQ